MERLLRDFDVWAGIPWAISARLPIVNGVALRVSIWRNSENSMGYYLTSDLVQAVADGLAPSIEGQLEGEMAVSVIVADLSCRAVWDVDKMMEEPDGASPLVLFANSYGDVSAGEKAENEKLAETAILMMDREGVPLETLFHDLRQNLEEGDLFPSTEAVGLVAGHLAIAVVGLDKTANSQISQQFLNDILGGVSAELAHDDETTPSNFVGDEEEEGEPGEDAAA